MMGLRFDEEEVRYGPRDPYQNTTTEERPPQLFRRARILLYIQLLIVTIGCIGYWLQN